MFHIVKIKYEGVGVHQKPRFKKIDSRCRLESIGLTPCGRIQSSLMSWAGRSTNLPTSYPCLAQNLPPPTHSHPHPTMMSPSHQPASANEGRLCGRLFSSSWLVVGLSHSNLLRGSRRPTIGQGPLGLELLGQVEGCEEESLWG